MLGWPESGSMLFFKSGHNVSLLLTTSSLTMKSIRIMHALARKLVLLALLIQVAGAAKWAIHPSCAEDRASFLRHEMSLVARSSILARNSVRLNPSPTIQSYVFYMFGGLNLYGENGPLSYLRTVFGGAGGSSTFAGQPAGMVNLGAESRPDEIQTKGDVVSWATSSVLDLGFFVELGRVGLL